MIPNVLITTVGTSLLNPKSIGGRNTVDRTTDWDAVSADLAFAKPDDHACGAEINSIHSLLVNQKVQGNAVVYLLHSDTEAGVNIARLLVSLLKRLGHESVKAVPIIDLQDKDPKRFKTKGLRNLAKEVCRIIRNHSAQSCIINATGGYKAQIAVAVLLGQAIGIPVYYMFEGFSEIIAFPPMPVSLDFNAWMRVSGLLTALEKEPCRKSDLVDEWDPVLDSLVDLETIDDVEYVELSPTGQIFHDTFRERYRQADARVLPPATTKKQTPHFEDAGWPGTFPDALRFMKKVTAEIPFVTRCATHYFNPDLPKPTLFRISRDGIEGVYSDKSRTMRFFVETTANTPGERDAALAALNDWLERQ